jgi:hypothetical protein
MIDILKARKHEKITEEHLFTIRFTIV